VHVQGYKQRKNTNTQAKEQYIWEKNLLHMLNVNKIILSRAAVKKSGVCFQFNAGLIVFLVGLTFFLHFRKQIIF